MSKEYKDGTLRELFIEGDSIVSSVKQDVAPILDYAERLRNWRGLAKYKEDGLHVASIPIVIINQWRNEGFDVIGGHTKNGLTKEEYDRELFRRLNEYSKLKTTEAKL